jgi:hypothetical protein
VRACFMLLNGEREREIEIERERVCERERERERERCRMCPEMLFLFFKGMMGALAPFSYLVKYVILSYFYPTVLLQTPQNH